eukprot:CAMPEP_0202922332 /NCGR_PEP_ID=MMETSP1392-20130828/77863_1 /ASSEMBLY_ACC=CAM_ASM_000868 /TAXON_ID=225041 /ORGANISM="Chlamydomonas chlamydogama, Strain SAG 11-48b" /LENGTH=252 /DNA_ID=CAMNT_0049615951 /DNA_START=1792 /DNA_END=2550 /DNA_ORIENTATION=-
MSCLASDAAERKAAGLTADALAPSSSRAVHAVIEFQLTAELRALWEVHRVSCCLRAADQDTDSLPPAFLKGVPLGGPQGELLPEAADQDTDSLPPAFLKGAAYCHGLHRARLSPPQQEVSAGCNIPTPHSLLQPSVQVHEGEVAVPHQLQDVLSACCYGWLQVSAAHCLAPGSCLQQGTAFRCVALPDSAAQQGCQVYSMGPSLWACQQLQHIHPAEGGSIHDRETWYSSSTCAKVQQQPAGLGRARRHCAA